MYEYIAMWYEEHNLFGIQLSRVQKYEILLECGTNHIISYMESGVLSERAVKFHLSTEYVISVYRELLICDLYLREHMKNRPSFCPSLDQWKDKIRDILYEESKTHKLFPILSDCNYRELTKALHIEVFEHIFDRPTAIIFCYEKRNPLSKNCSVQYFTIE